MGPEQTPDPTFLSLEGSKRGPSHKIQLWLRHLSDNPKLTSREQASPPRGLQCKCQWGVGHCLSVCWGLGMEAGWGLGSSVIVTAFKGGLGCCQAACTQLGQDLCILVTSAATHCACDKCARSRMAQLCAHTILLCHRNMAPGSAQA